MKTRTFFDVKNDRNIALYYWRKALVGNTNLQDLRSEEDMQHYRHIQFERWKCKRKMYELGLIRQKLIGPDVPFFLKRQAN